jgi:hypothetical protein
MLGLLCSSEPHPKQVNEKVCGGLLRLLQSSSCSMVMCEVFNALMDMYGDDGHVEVFESLDALGNVECYHDSRSDCKRIGCRHRRKLLSSH